MREDSSISDDGPENFSKEFYIKNANTMLYDEIYSGYLNFKHKYVFNNGVFNDEQEHTLN
jgi:hypothetical protein